MSSLGTNRIGRYLLYAIGEIILVIVGILIALQINNRNEQIKNELKIQTILQEVQRNLETDFNDLDRIIEVYELKDSLIDMVLTDTLSEEDYRRNPGMIMLMTTYLNFACKDNAYKNLMRYSDFIPNDYNHLIPQLDEVYFENNSTIKEMQKQLGDLVNETLRKWSKEYTWYLDLNQGRYNPSFVEFFLSDPFYKNDLVTYQIYASDNLLRLYKRHQLLSVQAYRSIHKLIESEDSIPQSMAEYFIELDPKQQLKFTGKFRSPQGIDIQIFEEEGELMGQVIGQNSLNLYAKSDSVLFNPIIGIKLVFTRNTNGTAGFKFYQNKQELFFERQKELAD